MVSPSPELTVWPLKLPMVAVVETKLISPSFDKVYLDWADGKHIETNGNLPWKNETCKIPATRTELKAIENQSAMHFTSAKENYKKAATK